MIASCGTELYWHNCYSGSFDLITPESVAHPAKMAPKLCFRILEHLDELGLLNRDSVVLDPMAGTGMTALCAGARGLKAITVELEPYFRDLQGDCDCQGVTELLFKRMLRGSSNRTRKLSYIGTRVCPACQLAVDERRRPKGSRTIFRSQPHFYAGNKGRASDKLYHSVDWQIIQGDSRHLSKLLAERGLVTLTSPPYQDSRVGQESGKGAEITDRRIERLKAAGYDPEKILTPGRRKHGNLGEIEHYSDNSDNIGNLKDVPLATITSPPYGIADTSGGLNTKPPRSPKDQAGRSPASPSQAGAKEGYGETEGQIGTLPDKPLATIMSPPYGETLINPAERRFANPGVPMDKEHEPVAYGESDANINRLPDKPLTTITSPPYEHPMTFDGEKKRQKILAGQTLGQRDDVYFSEGNKAWQGLEAGYGETNGQLANYRKESYLSAMSLVYSEIARVSNVLVVVIKNPTRAGKLRRLDLDTLAILDKAGWKLRCQHRALLFEELEQATLDGGVVKKPKGRLSFFKRLNYQKGAPVASWEDILVCQRP